MIYNSTCIKVAMLGVAVKSGTYEQATKVHHA